MSESAKIDQKEELSMAMQEAEWDRRREAVKSALVGAGFEERPVGISGLEAPGFKVSLWYVDERSVQGRGVGPAPDRGYAAVIGVSDNLGGGSEYYNPQHAEILEAAGFAVQRPSGRRGQHNFALVTDYPEVALNAEAMAVGEAPAEPIIPTTEGESV